MILLKSQKICFIEQINAYYMLYKADKWLIYRGWKGLNF